MLGIMASQISGHLFVPPVVTGGTLTSDATYYYRTFTANGTLGVSGGSVSFDCVTVAGGGGGSPGRRTGTTPNFTYDFGAGGGAGGLVYATNAYSTNQTITIGAGGPGGATDLQGSNGTNTVLGATTATGGGKGASMRVPGAGGAGGSGGGGNMRYVVSTSTTTLQ